jgi:Tfp pilus assembly protein PilN
MVNINFVPDDYIQGNESRRANLMCLVLFMIVMAALGGSFVTIKMRQNAFCAKENLVNAKMARVRETIKQFEELQARRKEMMKTALVTAQLLEPVPRSVLLASLTNNLPAGVSLLKVSFIQKEPKQTGATAPASKYQAAKVQTLAAQTPVSPEKSLETYVDIGGIAPSDLQVAAYIERLSTSSLLVNVALVESKEYKIEDTTFRRFRLTAMLQNDVHLTRDDVDRIRVGLKESAQSAQNF